MPTVKFAVPADRIVGETMKEYQTRMMGKKNPFVIPLVVYGRASSTKAHLDEMTTERVRGTIHRGEMHMAAGQKFDVKHDGKSFSVGSGSSKKRFYFKNWDK